MTAPRRRRPEKFVERQVLREVGRLPQMLIGINTVGIFYRPSALPALCAALRPFGPEVVRCAVDILARHRSTVGLGTGSPDLVGSYHGAAFGFELKSEVGTVEAHQSAWHTAAARRGFPVFVVRSPSDAMEALAQLDAGRCRCRRGGVE